ncbi:MAG TPA: TraR/DksA C4-type zinc finger protein [Patescibacteria group bacterium]|nr:TraR/DksA C4-type zinc finger protein [Patescibacteria group bacterium]
MDQIKEKLLAEKARLEAELQSYKSEDPFLAEDRGLEVNSLDNDSIENESHDRIAATRNGLKQDLSRVLLALEKLEQGTYGKCIKCGQDIEAERLQANPAAATCMSHAT